jgi:hypothetical protein
LALLFDVNLKVQGSIMKEDIIESFSWNDAVNETYQNISQRFIDYAPQLIGAILLLIFGWLLARFLRLTTRKVVEKMDVLFRKIPKSNSTKYTHLKHSYTRIISQGVYWIVILFFLTASANLLGWNLFTGWMDSIVGFLPDLITGLFIIFVGYLISGGVRSAISNSRINTGNFQINRIALGAQFAIVITSVIIGAEQIGLNVHFLTSMIVVIIGIILAGACLAFALGAKMMAANAIGAQYTRKNCSIGDYMKIGEVEGEILEIRQTCIILETKTGRAIVPAKLFHEQVSLLSSVESESELSLKKNPSKEGDSNE